MNCLPFVFDCLLHETDAIRLVAGWELGSDRGSTGRDFERANHNTKAHCRCSMGTWCYWFILWCSSPSLRRFLSLLCLLKDEINPCCSLLSSARSPFDLSLSLCISLLCFWQLTSYSPSVEGMQNSQQFQRGDGDSLRSPNECSVSPEADLGGTQDSLTTKHHREGYTEQLIVP